MLLIHTVASSYVIWKLETMHANTNIIVNGCKENEILIAYDVGRNNDILINKDMRMIPLIVSGAKRHSTSK